MMRSRHCLPLCLLLASLLTGCGAMPDIGALPEGPAGNSPPALLPLDQLMASLPAEQKAKGTTARLSERLARLQNRARIMQGALDDPATRERLRGTGPA